MFQALPALGSEGVGLEGLWGPDQLSDFDLARLAWPAVLLGLPGSCGGLIFQGQPSSRPPPTAGAPHGSLPSRF